MEYVRFRLFNLLHADSNRHITPINMYIYTGNACKVLLNKKIDLVKGVIRHVMIK